MALNGLTNLALAGPTLEGSNDELAVMAESGISPEFIPSAVRHSPGHTHNRSISETIDSSVKVTVLLQFLTDFKDKRGRGHMTHITMLTHPGKFQEIQRPLFWILLTQRWKLDFVPQLFDWISLTRSRTRGGVAVWRIKPCWLILEISGNTTTVILNFVDSAVKIRLRTTALWLDKPN